MKQYSASFRTVPKRIVLDLDETFDAVHGAQPLRLFKAITATGGWSPRCFAWAAGSKGPRSSKAAPAGHLNRGASGPPSRIPSTPAPLHPQTRKPRTGRTGASARPDEIWLQSPQRCTLPSAASRIFQAHFFVGILRVARFTRPIFIIWAFDDGRSAEHRIIIP